MIHAGRLNAPACGSNKNKSIASRPGKVPVPGLAKITPCFLRRAGELSIMNPAQQTTSHSVGVDSVVHLTVTADEAKMMAEDPERVMEEMWLRATQVSSVLEDILREPHGIPRWG